MTKDEDGGSVEGYVFDAETLEPISGASLSYQGKTAISASGGYYRIDAPYRKADTLTAEASGYAPWRISVAASGTGEVNTIDVPMRRICQWTISGTVYGKTYDHKTGDWVETPLAGATVAWGPATVTTQERCRNSAHSRSAWILHMNPRPLTRRISSPASCMKASTVRFRSGTEA